MTRNRKTALELWGSWFARARERKMMSQDALAKAAYLSKSTVAMWETGRRFPRLADLARAEEVLETGGDMTALLTEWVGREVSQEWMDKWRLIEEQTKSLLWFQPLLVPGLLQIEDYARAVLRAGRPDVAEVEDLVAMRLERQHILAGDKPPILVAMLDEGVLLHNVGGAAVMSAQLQHLLSMAERDHIVVQIIPMSKPACAGFTGPFGIASVDGRNEVAFVDGALRGAVVEQPEDVAAVRRMWDIFRGYALPKEESTDLIRRIVKEKWAIA